MAAKSLRTFMCNFIQNGRTEERYGDFYAVSGPTADVLIQLDSSHESDGTAAPAIITITLIRTKAPDGEIVVFYNKEKSSFSRKRDSFSLRDIVGAFTKTSFPIPKKTFNVSRDLSNLQVIDVNKGDMLIKLPEGKFLISRLPTKAVSKEHLLNIDTSKEEGESHLMIVGVSSTTTVASKQCLIPDGITDQDKFLDGVWLIDQGESEIEGFNPTPEEINLFQNRPQLSEQLPCYDVLLSSAIANNLSVKHTFAYKVSFNGRTHRGSMEGMGESGWDKHLDLFTKKLHAWEKTAREFNEKYLAFKPDNFFSQDRCLMSLKGVSAQYYNDGKDSYIKGTLIRSHEIGYSGESAAPVFTNWHKLTPPSFEFEKVGG